LGCLGQLALMLVGGVIAGIIFVIAVDFVFARWAFYLGGAKRVIPVWQGIGRMRGPGGDYVLYVWFAPTPGGRTLPLPSVDGTASLCTPRGDRFSLRAMGNFVERSIGTDSNGKEMHLTVRPRSFFGSTDLRPHIDLRGRWRNDTLELDDDGSLSRAFLADGTLFTGRLRDQPRTGERASLVLHELPWRWFPDCRVSDR